MKKTKTIKKKMATKIISKAGLRLLGKKANAYADKKMGMTILDYIQKRFPITKKNENYTPEKWCSIFETDQELKKFEDRHTEFFKKYLSEAGF